MEKPSKKSRFFFLLCLCLYVCKYIYIYIYIKKVAKRIKWAETVCYIKFAGLKRCGKSCRLRWLNYLRPDIKRGNITRDEEELIIRLHNLLGNRSSISSNSFFIYNTILSISYSSMLLLLIFLALSKKKKLTLCGHSPYIV